MQSKLTVSLLLGCSILAILTTSPHAISQTAVTSYEYSTTSLTTTIYSTYLTTATSSQLVQYVSTPFDYSAATDSFSLRQVNFRPLLFMNDAEDIPCAYYETFVFNATQGNVIQFNFELSIPGRSLAFLIMNSGQYWSFEHTNCFYSPPAAMAGVYAPAYSGNWTIPQSGLYAFVFFSYGFYGGKILFSARELTPFTLTQSTSYTSTSILQNTNMIISTETTSSTESSSPSTTLELPSWLPVVLFVAVLVGIALMIRKRLS